MRVHALTITVMQRFFQSLYTAPDVRYFSDALTVSVLPLLSVHDGLDWHSPDPSFFRAGLYAGELILQSVPRQLSFGP